MRKLCSASWSVRAPFAGTCASVSAIVVSPIFSAVCRYRSTSPRTAFALKIAFSRKFTPSSSLSAVACASRTFISAMRVSSPSRIVGPKSAVRLKTTPFSPNAVPAALRAFISSSEWRSGICFTVRRKAIVSPSRNAGVSAFSISSRPIRARDSSSTPSATNRFSRGFQSTSLRNFFCSLSNVLFSKLVILSFILCLPRGLAVRR